jgi:hypothetical protein
LRAAELADFGMVGVGRIFEMYRDGILTDDDEVALQHGPAEMGYMPLTEPMVNVRATLDAAVDRGVLSSAIAVQLVDAAKTMFYKDRTRSAVVLSAMGRVPIASRASLAGWFELGWIDQKRADAFLLLARIEQSLDTGSAWIGPFVPVNQSSAWMAAMSALRDRV